MNNKDSPNDVTEKIEIFSTEDEKIKSFGELLTNDSSRNMLQILMTEELTALDLSKKTGLSLPLVIYHLNKMQDLNVIQISKVGTNVKGQDMKFYKATKFAVVILPASVSEKAKESKSLLRSFNSIYRFAGIAIAGVAAWFTSVSMQEPRTVMQPVLDSEIIQDQSEVTLREFQGAEEQMEQEESAPVPEPEPAGEFTSGDGSGALEESLELAQRKIEATADASSGFGAVPEYLVLPIIITIAVVGAGLFLELLYRMRTQKLKN